MPFSALALLSGLGKTAALGSALKAAPAVLGTLGTAAWNKKQVDTSYQRTMRDMKHAGINPLLAGKVGPIGSATMSDLGHTITSAKSAETQRQQTTANVDKIDQEIENLKTTNDLTEQQITNLRKTYFEIIARTEKTSADATGVSYENIYKSIIASHQRNSPGMTIAKYYGVDASTLTKSILEIIKAPGTVMKEIGKLTK